jgi:hypothetical protein
VDTSGSLMRTDKVVSLYLQRLRNSALLSVAQVVAMALEKLGPR